MSSRLPESLRAELKIPLGILIPDLNVNKIRVLEHVGSCNISVGDRTSQRLVEFGIVPDLQIVDSYEKRSPRELPFLPPNTVEMFCKNPAGCITSDSVQKIKDAFASERPVRLVVSGEEDLLVIPVCMHAPDDSVVFYGQPNQGMVVVHIDQKIRQKTQRLVDLMDKGE